MSKRVVVVGAGLAGLSCAVQLVRHGYEVLVLEAKRFIGGRTSSWNERGMAVESGLHRVLGFYRALPALLRDIGVELDEIVHWEDEVEIRLPDSGISAVFGSSPVLKPLKTLCGFIGNNSIITPHDKVKLPGFFYNGFKDYWLRPHVLDTQTVLCYAQRHDLSAATIERFLVPFTAGIFFIPPERYSAYAFFGLLAPLLRSAQGMRSWSRDLLYRTRIGAFKGGMTDILAEPFADFVRQKGSRVEVDSPVDRLTVEGVNSVQGVMIAGERVNASHVVLATSLGAAQRIVQADFRDHPWFRPMLRLPSMPVVTIQFDLDTPSLPVDRTTFGPYTHMASFAEQSRTTFKGLPGRLSVILSPPEEFLHAAHDAVCAITRVEALRLGLRIESTVRDYRVISHPEDFYSLTPGSEELRPPQQTPVDGLILAGDYTRQENLATMEGAVVSGMRAAELVRESTE